MKFLKIAAVLAAVSASLAFVRADGNDVVNAQGREYVEIDGKPYLKDSDGNYIQIEIKAEPVDESRKARPARGRKYGTPHSSTWRVDESKVAAQAQEEKPAPSKKEDAVDEKPEINCKLGFGDNDSTRKLSYSFKAERIEKLADGKYSFVLLFKASVVFASSPDKISVDGARSCIIERGAEARVKLLSFPNPSGENLDLQATLSIK